VQAALAQARQKAPPPQTSVVRRESAQGRFPPSPVVRRTVAPVALRPTAPAHKGSSTVQRAAAAAAVPMKQIESSQSTYLTATLATGVELASNLASTAAGHSEDRLIDEILPKAAGADLLDAKADNILLIGINRSPCASTVYTPSGEASCNKGGGRGGCTERLIHLAQHGLTVGGTSYTFKIYLNIREIYGTNGAQRANSIAANEAMAAAGIEMDQQRTASSGRFFGTSAAKLISRDQ
jgi:hypothetical protein